MKLNHLKTFETYTNEDFNPLKSEDWKSAGNTVRKGFGFLTPEELIEKGKQMIAKSAKYKAIYDQWLKKDPIAAEKFITFIAENPNTVYYGYVDGKWVDTGNYNWGEGKGRVKKGI